MTTDNNIRRDMKKTDYMVTDYRLTECLTLCEVNARRNVGTWRATLKRAQRFLAPSRPLLTLLFLVGEVANEAWAEDARCYVINNRGKRVFNFDTDNTSLTVPKRAGSLFATNFRFYVSEEEAVKDAKGEPTDLISRI